MLEWLSLYGLFFAKVFTIVAGIIITFGAILALGGRQSKPAAGSVSITKLNDEFEERKEQLQATLLDKSALKALQKEKAKAEKLLSKENKKNKKNKNAESNSKPRAFVLDFDGDMKASEAEGLAHKVNSILSISQPTDEIIVRLESPGGVVHGYGLAASQLKRIPDNKLKLTICVDKVAASGGYMMACVADRIIAAPFAIIGSIGVVAQLPNFNRLLKKHDIDYDIYTAGEYKRTVTMLGENTEAGKKKLTEDLLQTHELFKDMIKENRPDLDVASVATGEIWYGQQAIEKGLIDQVGTSDDYIMTLMPDYDLYKIDYRKKEKLSQRLGLGIGSALERAFVKFLEGMSQITGK